MTTRVVQIAESEHSGAVASVPKGYKQTDVGLIPQDWKVITIAQIAPLQRGYDLPKQFIKEGPYPVVYSNGVINYHDTAMVHGPGVVTGRSGTLGRVHYIESDYWPHNTSLWVTSFNGNIPQFVFYLYTAIGFERFSSGSGVPTLNRNDAHSFRVALPPTKAEQEAIAEALSDTDALIESLEQLIAKKRQIKLGTMQELLTCKKRLPGFSKAWEASPLRRFVRQFIVPMRDKPKCFTGNIPWCRIEDFDGTYLRDSKSGQYVDIETIRTMNLKVYPTGTLLVSCSADLGRCAIVDQPLVSNQTFIGLEMDQTVSSTLFFYYFMSYRAQELNNLSSGTTISYLSREEFEEFIVFVPFDRKEQIEIAQIFSDMDAEITLLEVKLGKARLIKQGMVQELLTGRIRLV